MVRYDGLTIVSQTVRSLMLVTCLAKRETTPDGVSQTLFGGASAAALAITSMLQLMPHGFHRLIGWPRVSGYAAFALFSPNKFLLPHSTAVVDDIPTSVFIKCSLQLWISIASVAN